MGHKVWPQRVPCTFIGSQSHRGHSMGRAAGLGTSLGGEAGCRGGGGGGTQPRGGLCASPGAASPDERYPCLYLVCTSHADWIRH